LDPSHKYQPVGAVVPRHIIIPPEGTEYTAAATPRLVLALAAVVALVPPLAIGIALTKPADASNKPEVFKLLANWDKLYD
jgi:hypothetical protein